MDAGRAAGAAGNWAVPAIGGGAAGSGASPMRSASAANVLFMRTIGYPKAPAFSSRARLFNRPRKLIEWGRRTKP